MMHDPDDRYHVTEMLFEDRRTQLFRAARNTDGLPVILKALTPRHGPRDLDHLRNAYTIGRRLSLSSVVSPLALDTYRHRPALITEDFGEALSRQLGAATETGRFLSVAVRIAAAVVDIHRQGVVHKDLKPESILVHPETGEVKITNLEIAAFVPCGPSAVRSARLIEGSLPYMSPEQTGWMTRPVDQRSDLYSMGVTFYEMLTGALPFLAEDPVEWIHCHVARLPAPPAEIHPSVPAVLSAMVMKLLAKEAEERYQSAASLYCDLERCLKEWHSTSRIEPFSLGAEGVPDRFQIPQTLYGREPELEALRSAFERAVETGAPELVLVSGYSGIGKSSLVHELYKPIAYKSGFFASGKFDQYKRDIPYSTIVQAFRELVLALLTESEEQIEDWRGRLQTALGVNAQIIIDVIPPVELVIGRQPPVPELPPTEAENRFHGVFRRFVGVFTGREHPLALFLDDLQWADTASLTLLRELVTQPEMHHFLLVGAYRDNEVSPSHPLMLTLEAVRRSGARLSHIVLGPLSAEHLNELVGEALRCTREAAAPLAGLIHERTAGNPFFARHFLTALHDQRLIEFDPRARAWQWDASRIRAQGFTDDVIDLMVEKLRRLPDATGEALKLLASVGDRARIAELAMLRDRTEEETLDELRDAVRAGLLIQLGDAFLFAHDRVQEAAYSLIPEDERPRMHLRIGRILVSRLPEDLIEERVFDIANQLNHGAALIDDASERASLCWLNFSAGRRAKAAIAYAAARGHLAQATALLPPEAWIARYEDAFSLYLDRSECEYLVGEFERADDLFNQTLEKARSDIDRARVYSLRLRLRQVSGRYDEGVTVALEGLRLFGVTVADSEQEIQAATAAELRQIQINLRGRRIADLLDAPTVTDPNVRAIIGLLVEAEPCAYIGRPKLFPLLALKAVNVSLQHGNTSESCFAYSVYGFMLVSVFGDIPAGFEFSEMSLRLNEKFRDTRLRGTLLHLHGDHINFWRKHIATDLPILERAFVACLEVGDLVYAGFLAFETVWQVMEKGDPLDQVLETSRRFADFARQSHNDAVYETIRVEQQFVACLKGSTRGPSTFDDASFDEEVCLAAITKATFGCGVVFFHIMKQITAFTYGRNAEALESAERAAPVLGAALAMPIEATHHFYKALTLAALYPDVPAARQRELTAILDEEVQRFRVWAAHCPENFQNRFALVSAEVARIEGRESEATRLYEEAIRSAGENGFVQNEALANELAARFHRARGLDRMADGYLREARACYMRWGADGKARQLAQLYPQLVEQPFAPTATIFTPAEHLDVLSVLKASQAISGELVLDRLLNTLVRIVIEQAGAQKGYVILVREGRLTIGAEACIEDRGAVRVELPSPMPEVSFRRLPASIVNYARRTKEKVLLDDATASPKFGRDEYVVRLRPRSVLCMPILKQGELVGLLYLENDLVAGAFTADRLTVLDLLASQAAISLENALLLSNERAARLSAQEAERRAAFFAEASALLGASLDCDEVLKQLAQLAVRELADWCVIDLLEDGQVRRVAGAHRDPAKEKLLDELRRRYPPVPGSLAPMARVLQTSEPLLLREIDDAVLAKACASDDHFSLIRRLGSRTGVFAPLIVRGRTIGAISFGADRPGLRYDRADLDLAVELARRAAMALDNARLHRKTEEAVRLRDEFLSVASHELRTPITSLQLMVQGLTKGVMTPSSENGLRALRVIERQVDRLNRLVEELLSVSRLQAGRLELHLEALDLTAVVQDVLERFELESARVGCTISLRAGSPVMGRWDRSCLDHVLANLLSNALKFGAGRPIEIVAEERPPGAARLVVVDHGVGIRPERLPYVFERFERAVVRRTGVGALHRAEPRRGLARRRSGRERVRLRERLHGGVALRGTPRRLSAASAAGRARRGMSASTRGGPVLVVDDDPDIRETISFLLESVGHEVVTAANGEEALLCLREGLAPCMILLDLMMPIMSGWQFRDEQRRDPALSAIPVVILTGAGNAAEHAATLGVTGYLEKPVPLDTLLSTVRRFAGA